MTARSLLYVFKCNSLCIHDGPALNNNEKLRSKLWQVIHLIRQPSR